MKKRNRRRPGNLAASTKLVQGDLVAKSIVYLIGAVIGYRIPADPPEQETTIDAEFEIIEQKQLPSSEKNS